MNIKWIYHAFIKKIFLTKQTHQHLLYMAGLYIVPLLTIHSPFPFFHLSSVTAP